MMGLYYRIPLMSYAIFLAMVARMISLTQVEEVRVGSNQESFLMQLNQVNLQV